MKKALILILSLIVCLSAFADPFADVPNSHWAYKAIKDLSGRGILQGYKDGTFKGNRTLTRYEAAMMVAKVMSATKGGGSYAGEDLRNLEKLIVEFSDELSLLGVKITSLEDQIAQLKGDMAVIKSQMTGARSMGVPMMGSGKIDITGDMKMEFGTRKYETEKTHPDNLTGYERNGRKTVREDDMEGMYQVGLNVFANIDEDVTGFLRIQGTGTLGDDQAQYNNADGSATQSLFDGIQRISYNNANGLGTLQDMTFGVEYAYIDVKNISNLGDLRLGRQNITVGHNLVYAGPSDGIKFDKVFDQVSVSAFAFDSNESVFDSWTGSEFLNGGDSYKMFPDRNAAAFADLINADIKRQNKKSNGFDSIGLKASMDFGGHALGGYYFSQSYDEYDPYIRMGDAYAVQYSTVHNVDGHQKTDSQLLGVANDDNGQITNLRAPSADPTWVGLTLDGNVLENLDYFFEYASYDSDLPAYIKNDIALLDNSGPELDAQGNVTRPNSLKSGKAWLLGIDWDLTDDYNLIVQYGVGDEEFVPSSIDYRQKLNGMRGRWNAQSSGLFDLPTCSLQGIKDLFVKFSADFTDKTSGFVSLEKVSENESNLTRQIVATDGYTWGGVAAPGQIDVGDLGGLAGNENLLRTVKYVKPTDYTGIELGLKHQFRPNTTLALNYYSMKYDQDRLAGIWADGTAGGGNNAGTYDPAVTVGEHDVNTAPNAGGWSTIKGSVEVKF